MCLLSVFNITANITEIRIKTQIIKEKKTVTLRLSSPPPTKKAASDVIFRNLVSPCNRKTKPTMV